MTHLSASLGDPTNLASAVAIAHAAVQPLTKAARANLVAEPDDSHSNLEWADGMFLSHLLAAEDITYQVGLSLAPLCLILLKNGVRIADIDLAGKSLANAEAWLDTQLQQVGLKPAGPITLSYELPPAVADIDRFQSDAPGLDALSAWYALAAGALTDLAAELQGLSPGPSPVRCWPHHFDIATYIGLEVGDLETAKGIGAGLSPGDSSYDQPYFYVNPWPHLNAATLPKPPAPGHWHTTGFVGAIATGTEVLTLEDPASNTLAFLRESVAIGRSKLGV